MHNSMIGRCVLCVMTMVLMWSPLVWSEEIESSGAEEEGAEEAVEAGEVDSAQDPFSVNPFGTEPGQEPISEEERHDRAVELAQEGRLAFEEHRLEDAARLLERSYGLYQQSSVLYPLAMALHGLGHYEAAEERLRRYMAEANLDGSQRYVLQLQLQGWRRQFSRVSIETEPTGAEILLGRQSVGTTPLAEPLILPNGEYQLEAQLDGYRRITQQLLVPGGAPVDLRLVLERLGTGSTSENRGLRIGLWTMVGLTAATCVAAIVVGALWGAHRRELNDNIERSPEDVDKVNVLRGSTFGLIGAASGLSIASITMGVIYRVRSR